MATNIKEIISKCCSAPVSLGGESEFNGDIGTYYYVCTKCNLACDANSTQIGGNHYQSKTIQPWEAMESWFTNEEFVGYLKGNILKYIIRYKDKGGVEDLKKAQHYLAKLTEILEERL